MTLTAGDIEHAGGMTVELDSGPNTVAKGQGVTFDSSGYVSPTSENDDQIIGVISEVLDQGGLVSVIITGPVVHLIADGSVSKGDTVVPSANAGSEGHFTSHNGGMYVADGSTDDVAASHPFALEDAADGEDFPAVFR